MARKNVLAGLMAGPGAGPGAGETPAPSSLAGPPGRARGAVGAVSQSFADLKARSVLDIEPDLIDAGVLKDRLEADTAQDEALARSIEEHGQQVPVLVRPHPVQEGRFQIVFGRRRLAALRRLGRPVKALVRDLDDRAALMAQGQENSARRDLSFVEKANFARQMAAAGYDRKAVCDALSVDKTLISRMLSVAEKVPVEVIEYVGSAPGIGRERWLAAANRIAASGLEAEHLIAMIAVGARDDGPDARFDALQAYLDREPERRPPAPAPAPSRPEARRVTGATGGPLGSARTTPRAVVLRLDRAAAQGFEDWLLDRIPQIHRDWLAQQGGSREDDPAT